MLVIDMVDLMSQRELVLLSPYTVPAENPLLLGSEDVAAFMNGYSALWHPAVLQAAGAPPAASMRRRERIGPIPSVRASCSQCLRATPEVYRLGYRDGRAGGFEHQRSHIWR